MQQRQPRLGDILDDYCPRERRVTNHAVVAMIGDEVKQTRCTTCDAEHEYKHARIPRQRRKADQPAALYAQVAAAAPKRVTHDEELETPLPGELDIPESESDAPVHAGDAQEFMEDEPDDQIADEALDLDRNDERGVEDGPVHRPLIRATLPHREGQPPTVRQAPDFTIRQPAGRPNNRFRRHRGGQGAPGSQPGHGGHSFGGRNGNVAGGNTMRGGGPNRQGGMNARPARRQGQGGKRSK
jgi:hypothetical protein